MYLSNFHTHTTYCDGKHSAEEMVLSAISLGMTALGFSGHSYTPHDLSYCMTEEETKAYYKEINDLKEKYKDKIRIYCGCEMDYFAPAPIVDFDYTLGSVHYIYHDGEYLTVDESRDRQIEDTKKHFGSDIYAYAEKYFETVADVINKTKADFIGHFDLVSKFNEADCFYDSTNPRYVKAWKEAAKVLCETGKPFEINTGAIARGARKTPYPSDDMVKFIVENGGKLFLSSDCHHKDFLLCSYKEQFDHFKNIELIDFEDYLLSHKSNPSA